MQLSPKAMRSLVEYLQDHDEDIANEMNDFGDLKEVYQELCNKDIYFISKDTIKKLLKVLEKYSCTDVDGESYNNNDVIDVQNILQNEIK